MRQRTKRALGQGLRRRPRLCTQFRHRNQRIGQTDRDRRCPVDRLAEREHRISAGMADPRRQQMAGGGLRHQRQIDERRHQTRRVGDINQIAMQQHGGAHPDRIALHRSNQRPRGLGEILQKTEHMFFAFMRAFRLRAEVGEIVAGREAVAVALEQHDANCRILFRAIERIRHRAIHRVGERVLLVRPRQCHGQNAGLDVRLHVVSHGMFL